MVARLCKFCRLRSDGPRSQRLSPFSRKRDCRHLSALICSGMFSHEDQAGYFIGSRRTLQSDEQITANAIVRLQSTVIRVAAVVPLTSAIGVPLPTAS